MPCEVHQQRPAERVRQLPKGKAGCLPRAWQKALHCGGADAQSGLLAGKGRADCGNSLCLPRLHKVLPRLLPTALPGLGKQLHKPGGCLQEAQQAAQEVGRLCIHVLCNGACVIALWLWGASGLK